MDFIERFTEGARRALALAQESAKGMGHNYVGSEHLLLGLIREGESAAARALAQLNITEKDVAARADALVGHGDYHFTDSFGYTPRTKKILELSLYEACGSGTAWPCAFWMTWAVISACCGKCFPAPPPSLRARATMPATRIPRC